MNELLLKLVIPPSITGVAAIAGGRWGGKVSGALVALPLTSGCVTFFLAHDQGTRFAATASIGALVGTLGQGAFCLAYAEAARKLKWPLPLLAGLCGFAISAVALRTIDIPLFWLLTCALAALAFVSALLARRMTGFLYIDVPTSGVATRVVVTTATVLLITGVSSLLGPWMSGLLATFPLLGAVMAGFAHHTRGPDAAIHVLQGFALGLFSTCAFFIVIAYCVDPLGIAGAFGLATLAALATQAGLFVRLRRPA